MVVSEIIKVSLYVVITFVVLSLLAINDFLRGEIVNRPLLAMIAM